MDKISKEARSRTMSAIRSRGNHSTELKFRMALVRLGISGWVMHPREIKGCPDFFFPKQRLAVFVDGCFWHGCPQCYRRPNSRQEYWDNKLTRNVKRDRQIDEALLAKGYKVARVWEHQLLGDPQQVIREFILPAVHDSSQQEVETYEEKDDRVAAAIVYPVVL